MSRTIGNGLGMVCLAALLGASPVAAQQPGAAPPAVQSGLTRLDLVASGRVTRVPDVAIISAGVISRAATASAALADNATRMQAVRAALKRAGIAERDVRTASVNLSPQYRYTNDNQPPQLTGYQASNSLTIRFRDIARSGAILDALVAQGANDLNGPTLTLDRPEAAIDEARMAALADGQRRAEAYARALGKRVVRLVAVSEAGASGPRPPMPVAEAMMASDRQAAKTEIVPGEQDVEASLSMSFDLQ